MLWFTSSSDLPNRSRKSNNHKFIPAKCLHSLNNPFVIFTINSIFSYAIKILNTSIYDSRHKISFQEKKNPFVTIENKIKILKLSICFKRQKNVQVLYRRNLDSFLSFLKIQMKTKISFKYFLINNRIFVLSID